MENRRQFSRILFSTSAQLEFAGSTYPCKLLDVSLHGALITKCDAFNGKKDSDATLRFTLPQSDIEIKMEVFICHIEQKHIGLKCHHIDINSITYLKRLVELNLANEQLLHRELASLIEGPQ
ncbi:PilZ domain-containing protein [uncultured Pseudoalteromonas sp.]|uniref:PilZ domain-containing protein n=1 Tax=uncultured Pseudoalteromonas sp. TaxID=114053 RepID=UPI0030C7F184